jgi:hypothetical protein
MVTVHREGGFRFVIYRDDHPPAHVHVIKDGEIIVQLLGPAGQPLLFKITVRRVAILPRLCVS